MIFKVYTLCKAKNYTQTRKKIFCKESCTFLLYLSLPLERTSDLSTSAWQPEPKNLKVRIPEFQTWQILLWHKTRYNIQLTIKHTSTLCRQLLSFYVTTQRVLQMSFRDPIKGIEKHTDKEKCGTIFCAWVFELTSNGPNDLKENAFEDRINILFLATMDNILILL